MLVKRKRRKGPGQEGLITASPFLMPSLIGLLVFSLLPLLISAFISLTDWNGLDQLTAPGFFQEHFIGLDNYKAILSSPEFWGVLWNTFRYIIMYIPLMLVASLGVAYLLSRQRPGITAFRIIYYIPVLTSWVAASMIWKSMLSPEYGAVNNILAVFGIQGPGWLLDEAWAMPAIVLVSVWKDMGFFGLILLSGMVGINKSYYEAASLDGAGSWQKFWKITFPLIGPFFTINLVLSMKNALGTFDQVVALTEGGPNSSTETVTYLIWKGGLTGGEYAYQTANAVLFFIVLAIIAFVQLRISRSQEQI